MIDSETTDALVAAVRAVARAEIMPRFRNLDVGDVAEKAAAEDLVTVADRAAETALTARVHELLPEAAVVGEEAADEDPGALAPLAGDGVCVILDPVDGTANFARGIAVFGVILALREAGETTFGLLYDPVMDDWVMARKGEGAWFCREGAAPRRLRVRDERPMGQRTCFLSPYLFPREAWSGVSAMMPRFARAQTLRCSCHEYRQVALGHADALISAVSKPWDHAAGLLVLAEAGGVGGPLGGGAYDVTDSGAVLVGGTGPATVSGVRDLLSRALAA